MQNIVTVPLISLSCINDTRDNTHTSEEVGFTEIRLSHQIQYISVIFQTVSVISRFLFRMRVPNPRKAKRAAGLAARKSREEYTRDFLEGKNPVPRFDPNLDSIEKNINTSVDFSGQSQDAQFDFKCDTVRVESAFVLPSMPSLEDDEERGIHMLEFLIAPLTVKQFLEEYWEKKCLFIERHHVAPNYYKV